MSDSKKRTYTSTITVVPPLRLESPEFESRKEPRHNRECLTSRPPTVDGNREDLLNRLIEAIKAL
ncbi:MAG: hypothetical protein AB1457_00010 [Chloroflexota bacterium]|nr:MAG: hypothetical protein KatS3mg047_0345 [Bellilinea sp.]